MTYELASEKIHYVMIENGAAFILPKEYAHLQFTVKTNETPLKRIPADCDASVSRKRQKLDPELNTLPVDGDTVSQISEHAWFYTKGDSFKRSAIPVLKNLAISYSHGENKNLVKGDIIKLTTIYEFLPPEEEIEWNE